MINNGHLTKTEEDNYLIWPKSLQYYSSELKNNLVDNGYTNIMVTPFELTNKGLTTLPIEHLLLVLNKLQNEKFIRIVYNDDNEEEIMGIKIS